MNRGLQLSALHATAYHIYLRFRIYGLFSDVFSSGDRFKAVC